jgi:hypothetical protein
MQKMNYLIPSAMIGTGIVVGAFIGIGKIDVSALLLISPMIMFGCWIMAVMYVRRGNVR